MSVTLLASLLLFQAPKGVQVDVITVTGGGQDAKCEVRGMSAEGFTVVGFGTTSNNSSDMPFAWTATTGVVSLATPTDVWNMLGYCQATEISSNGLVVGGDALWIGDESKLISKFKKQSHGITTIRMSDLGKVPTEQASISAINHDGSVIAVGAHEEMGYQPFIWRASTGTLKPLYNGGKVIKGTIQGISDSGDVLVGSRMRREDFGFTGFVISKGKYREVKPPKGYKGASLEGITRTGKLAHGNFTSDAGTRGFSLDIPSWKTRLLPSGFMVSCTSSNGEVVGGWYRQEPAILIKNKVHRVSKFINKPGLLHVMAVAKTATEVFVLLDHGANPEDYRVKIPLSYFK